MSRSVRSASGTALATRLSPSPHAQTPFCREEHRRSPSPAGNRDTANPSPPNPPRRPRARVLCRPRERVTASALLQTWQARETTCHLPAATCHGSADVGVPEQGYSRPGNHCALAHCLASKARRAWKPESRRLRRHASNLLECRNGIASLDPSGMKLENRSR